MVEQSMPWERAAERRYAQNMVATGYREDGNRGGAWSPSPAIDAIPATAALASTA
jgi:hypothetical protein